jgi:two-component system sensor histidine kinase YesM
MLSIMQIRYRLLFKSLRFKLIFGLLIIVVPLVAIMIYNNLYAIKVVRNQVTQSNKSLISLYMGQIDTNLEEVNKYLYNFAALETDLNVMELPKEQNLDQYTYAKIQLNNKLLKDLPNYKLMDTFFIYSLTNQDLLMVMSDQSNFNVQQATETKIIQIIQNQRDKAETTDNEWFSTKSGDDYFLTRVIKYGTIYIGARVNVNKLMVPLNLIDLGSNGKALLITESYQAMTHQAFVEENQIDLNYAGEDYKLTGDNKKFLVSGEKSAKGGFGLIAVIPDSVILENLPFLRRIVTFISMGALVLLPLIVFLLRKTILTPINRIIMAMRRIEGGNLDVRLTDNPSVLEFEIMNQSFNHMLSQIQELKVNVLEEQLNLQKAELQHLQLQINPHFFINSLNIVYNLAQVKDYNLIQEMTLCLVEYFRFMFRSNLIFVTLKDEIEHVHNYLRIQEMRFPQNLTYDLFVSGKLMEGLIPPLVIQTFVENTIKHAVSMDKQVHIEISIHLEGNNKIKIRVQDTGGGFPKDVLSSLQMNIDMGNKDGNHIGIWNVQRRLHLLYQEQAQITFSNGVNQGAVIEILIPLQE